MTNNSNTIEFRLYPVHSKKGLFQKSGMFDFCLRKNPQAIIGEKLEEGRLVRKQVLYKRKMLSVWARAVIERMYWINDIFRKWHCQVLMTNWIREHLHISINQFNVSLWGLWGSGTFSLSFHIFNFTSKFRIKWFMLGLSWRATWKYSKWEDLRTCQVRSLFLLNTSLMSHVQRKNLDGETGRLVRGKNEVTNGSLECHWVILSTLNIKS